MATSPAVPNVGTAPKSFKVITLAENEANGAYFLNAVRRSIENTTNTNLIREKATQTVTFDACTGALPSILHGLEPTSENRRDEDMYTVTFNWKPAFNVRATAVGKNSRILRDYVAQWAKERTPDKESVEGKMKAEPGVHGKIKAFNFTGTALNPYSSGRNNGTRSGSNWDRTRITADMAMAIQEMEVLYEDGHLEQVISIPNVARAGGSTVTEENPFA